MVSSTEPLPDSGGIIAIPIKITIDRSDPEVKRLIEIMEQPRRTPEDKEEWLSLLKYCKEDAEIDCEIEDKTGKFDFNTFTLKDFRSYKKSVDAPKKGVWKFANYNNHFTIGTSFINDRNNILPNECEILTCVDTYILKDESGIEIEKNLKSVWWMGYKYSLV